MSNLLTDGVYKFINVKYSPYAADHLNGLPLASVASYLENNDSNNQKWKIQNLGNNQFILQSVAAPNTYAGVAAYSNGAPVSGSYNPTIWGIRQVDGNKYQLTSADGNYVWVLPQTSNYVTIILRPASENPDGSVWTVKAA